LADEKKTPLEQQVVKLTADLANACWQIKWMQTRGGFTDAKTHSVRATRIEERLERLEIQMQALLDVAAFNCALLEDHLRDRHDANLDRDDAIDVTNWRRMRRRLREMAEKLGLMAKRRSLTETRQSENRLRPAQVHA